MRNAWLEKVTKGRDSDGLGYILGGWMTNRWRREPVTTACHSYKDFWRDVDFVIML